MTRPPLDAWARALKLLAARERTVAELEAALAARGHAGAEIAAAVERLVALRYLDDARVAGVRAQRLLAEGRSRADVAARLERAGLAAELIARALSPVGPDDDRAAAKALLAKRRLTGPKAARLLLSRGFDEELVRQLVELEREP